MICPNCKNEIPEDSAFCHKCGYSISGKMEEIKKKPNGKKKKIVIICSMLVIIAAAIIIGAIYSSQPVNKYSRAEKALENKNFKKAVKLYSELGLYEDAPDKLIEADHGLAYVQGKKLLDQAEYDEAIEKFNASDSYEDADELINKCYYQKGILLMDDNNYLDAAECFSKSIGYEDTNDKIIEIGKKLVENNEFEQAATVFSYSGNGKRDPYALYANGKIAYEKEDYEEAANYFDKAGDLLDAKNLYTDSTYKAAQKKFSEKKYSAARTLFNQIAEYEDSGEMLSACELMNAKTDMDNGNLNHAQNALKKMNADYEYDNIKVSDLLNILEVNSKWVDICGRWTSTSGQMRSTQSGSYRDTWWYADFEDGDVDMDVRCIINSDNTVILKLMSDVPVYYTYSSISAGVKTKMVKIDINQKVSDFGTIKYDDNTSVKVNSNGMSVNYKVVDKAQDVYFTYIYKTDVNYGKRASIY